MAFEQYKGVKLIYDNSRPQLDKQNALASKAAKSEETLSGGGRSVCFVCQLS